MADEARPRVPEKEIGPDPIEEAAAEGRIDGSNPGHIRNPLDQIHPAEHAQAGSKEPDERKAQDGQG